MQAWNYAAKVCDLDAAVAFIKAMGGAVLLDGNILKYRRCLQWKF